MPKKFDPETLEMINPKVNRNANPGQEVYILIHDGVWDYDTLLETEVYSNFADALLTFNKWMDKAKIDMREYCDEDQIEDDIAVNATNEQAHYEIYQRGNSSALYDEIYIKKERIR